MSNGNWYMGDFFGVLCMVIHGPFHRQFFKNNYFIFKPNYFIFFS